MRAGVHSTLGSSPGNFIFNRRKHLLHENLMRENQKRRGFDYAPQQRVLKKKCRPRKLDEQTSGPYKIVQTHVNGTVTIQLRLGLTGKNQYKASYNI
jgi:hypothetical protein